MKFNDGFKFEIAELKKLCSHMKQIMLMILLLEVVTVFICSLIL